MEWSPPAPKTHESLREPGVGHFTRISELILPDFERGKGGGISVGIAQLGNGGDGARISRGNRGGRITRSRHRSPLGTRDPALVTSTAVPGARGGGKSIQPAPRGGAWRVAETPRHPPEPPCRGMLTPRWALGWLLWKSGPFCSAQPVPFPSSAAPAGHVLCPFVSHPIQVSQPRCCARGRSSLWASPSYQQLLTQPREEPDVARFGSPPLLNPKVCALCKAKPPFPKLCAAAARTPSVLKLNFGQVAGSAPQPLVVFSENECQG